MSATSQLRRRRRCLGSSVQRRVSHMGAALLLLLQPCIAIADLERVVGLLSFYFVFRTCLRCLFQQAYVDIHGRHPSGEVR